MKNNVTDREFDKFRPADNDKSKVAVTVEQDPSDPIPVYQSLGALKNFFGESLTVPGSEITVLTHNVTEVLLKIMIVKISCHIEGKMTVYVNGEKIVTARTAPGKPDAEISYGACIELVTNDVIDITFKARPDSKIAEVEAFINANETT